ncbi:phosphopantetheine-binding protein [Streptomyces sp. NPDC003442]
METQTALQKEIRDFVLGTISEEMNHPLAADEISDDSPMGTGGIDIDSLGLIELLLRLERRFDVKFPDSDIEQAGAMNLGDLINDVVERGATA